MEKLGIDPILILVQVINFTILLLILRRFLYRPILKILAERKQRAEDIEVGKREIEELKSKIEKEKDEILDQSRKQAEKIMSASRIRGEKIQAQIEKDSQQKSKDILARAEQDSQSKYATLHDQLAGEVGKIAITVSEKVLQEKLSDQQKDRVLDQAITEFTKN